VAFSSDGKHIITASDGSESVVKLWQWSYGAGSDGVDNANGMTLHEHPPHVHISHTFPSSSDKFVLPEKYEPVASVRFSCNKHETSVFVVTCANGVIFGQWVS
jgi:hypothetical protein